MERTCYLCKKAKDLNEENFRKKSDGFRWECRICDNKRKRRWKRLERYRARDKKQGFETNLTREFIEKSLASRCKYCLGSEKITLDRICNNQGHSDTNCVAACHKCNIFRGNMPYEAWVLLVPALRKAKKLGLLNNWSPAGTGSNYTR